MSKVKIGDIVNLTPRYPWGGIETWESAPAPYIVTGTTPQGEIYLTSEIPQLRVWVQGKPFSRARLTRILSAERWQAMWRLVFRYHELAHARPDRAREYRMRAVAWQSKAALTVGWVQVNSPKVPQLLDRARRTIEDINARSGAARAKTGIHGVCHHCAERVPGYRVRFKRFGNHESVWTDYVCETCVPAYREWQGNGRWAECEIQDFPSIGLYSRMSQEGEIE